MISFSTLSGSDLNGQVKSAFVSYGGVRLRGYSRGPSYVYVWLRLTWGDLFTGVEFR